MNQIYALREFLSVQQLISLVLSPALRCERERCALQDKPHAFDDQPGTRVASPCHAPSRFTNSFESTVGTVGTVGGGGNR